MKGKLGFRLGEAPAGEPLGAVSQGQPGPVGAVLSHTGPIRAAQSHPAGVNVQQATAGVRGRASVAACSMKLRSGDHTLPNTTPQPPSPGALCASPARRCGPCRFWGGLVWSGCLVVSAWLWLSGLGARKDRRTDRQTERHGPAIPPSRHLASIARPMSPLHPNLIPSGIPSACSPPPSLALLRQDHPAHTRYCQTLLRPPHSSILLPKSPPRFKLRRSSRRPTFHPLQ